MSDSTQKIIEQAGGKTRCDLHGVELIQQEAVELFGRRFIASAYCPACQAQKEAQWEANANRLAEDAFRRNQERSGVPPRYRNASVDEFIAETPSERKVKAELVRFRDNQGHDPKNLIFCGTVGPGKTHAANALLNAWLRSGKSALYTTAMNLVRQVRDTYGSSQEKEATAVRRFTTTGLLALDELGAQLGTASEKAILADIINGRYERMLPTIVVGNLNAAEFVELLGERAMSRLQENGMILVFDWESRRGKVWANGGKAGQSERL